MFGKRRRMHVCVCVCCRALHDPVHHLLRVCPVSLMGQADMRSAVVFPVHGRVKPEAGGGLLLSAKHVVCEQPRS